MEILITNIGFKTVPLINGKESKTSSIFEFEIKSSSLKLTGTYRRKYSDTITFSEVEKEIIEQIRNIWETI